MLKSENESNYEGLTKLHFEFLESLIGDEGIYIQIIFECTIFDLGTLIFYLERAITEDCMQFLSLLDLLYAGMSPVGSAELDLMRAYKLINDLWNNTDVKFGENGLRTSLNHYFSSYGPVEPGKFKIAIGKLIRQKLASFRDQAEKIPEQKEKHKITEEKIRPDSGWRAALDLPSAQRTSRQQKGIEYYGPLEKLIHYGYLTPTESNQLLPAEESNLLSLEHLIINRSLTVKQVVNLTEPQRQILQDEASCKFLLEQKKPLAFITTLSSDQIRNLRSFRIQTLILKDDLSFEEALGLNKTQYEALNNDSFCKFILSIKKPPSWISMLTVNSMRWLKDSELQLCIKTNDISFAEACKLNLTQYLAICNIRFRSLLYSQNLPLSVVLNFSNDTIRHLHKFEIQNLIDEGDLDFKVAKNFTLTKWKDCFEHAKKRQKLNEKITELTYQMLTYPNSDHTAEIINLMQDPLFSLNMIFASIDIGIWPSSILYFLIYAAYLVPDYKEEHEDNEPNESDENKKEEKEENTPNSTKASELIPFCSTLFSKELSETLPTYKNTTDARFVKLILYCLKKFPPEKLFEMLQSYENSGKESILYITVETVAQGILPPSFLLLLVKKGANPYAPIHKNPCKDNAETAIDYAKRKKIPNAFIEKMIDIHQKNMEENQQLDSNEKTITMDP